MERCDRRGKKPTTDFSMQILPHSTDTATTTRTLPPVSGRGLIVRELSNPPHEVKRNSTGDQRKQRWARRRESSALLATLATPTGTGYARPVRPARCAWTIGQSVGIMHDGTRPAGYTGVERCSSIWACPHCGAVIRAGRAAEIEHAVTEHQKTGGDVLFFTGTVRHHRGDDLAVTLDAALDAWRRVIRGSAWKRKVEALGIGGYIRATEVTYGAHGWHPHIHALLLLDEAISHEKLDEFRAWLFDRWVACVERAGGKRPTPQGLDLQRVDKRGQVLARYLSKVQDEKTTRWSAGAELARGDVKQGRRASITPFELLDVDSDMPTEQRGALWREYYTATKGRRAITWSRGLKERYEVEEREDDDILDEAESTTPVWRTSARSYRAARRAAPGDVLLATALEHAEAENWAALAMILPPDETSPPQRE